MQNLFKNIFSKLIYKRRDYWKMKEGVREQQLNEGRMVKKCYTKMHCINTRTIYAFKINLKSKRSFIFKFQLS